MNQTLIDLAAIFTQLSLLAFGGGNTILPEMQRQVVEVHHWMTAQEFSALFALGQAAPGPNMMVVTLVGWHVAGINGMLVSMLAKFGPSSLVTIVMLQVWIIASDRWFSRRQRRLNCPCLNQQYHLGCHHCGKHGAGAQDKTPSFVVAVRWCPGGDGIFGLTD